ncbi:MAG: trypsin-like peptidase domain-containing protein [Parcubacteria group bacterium]|nr:trypsin-like peptidase domain-containing protein [Parcubacteria group bacterium]
MSNQEEKSTIDAIQKVIPAVVSIVISKHLPKAKQSLFAPLFGSSQEEGHEGDPVTVGGGSGVCIGSDGLILTNKHVVFDAEAEYSVLTYDEKDYPAKVLSRDPVNDIAILKVDAHGLQAITLGDSSKVQLGQTVIAIGTALGLFKNSVSKGIISGLGRRITASLGGSDETEELRGVFQTDVAINQGNSGGPLVNSDGEVIGINTAVIMGAQNIGFAIPINWAKKDLEDIKKYGRVVKPYLGLRYVMINSKLKDKYNLTVECGALVARDHLPNSEAVIKNSPAEKAGLKENDIIVEVAGKLLEEKSELADLIQEFKVGDELEIKYLRKGEKQATKLKLDERR